MTNELRLSERLRSELNEKLLSPLAKYQKLQWKCGICNGVWVASYYHRAILQRGCPYCSGQKVLPGFNDLKSRYPEIAKEYSSKNQLSSDQISCGSGRRVLWSCSECSQEYESIIYNKTKLHRSCPYCSGKRPIVGKTDLATLRPELSLEWGPRNPKSPQEYTVFSNQAVEWVCSEGHVWSSIISSRSGGSGCKRCSRSESKLEKDLLSEIRKLYSGKIEENNRTVLGGKEIDIYLPDLKVGIEFNGDYWHGDGFLSSKRNTTSHDLHTNKRKRAEKAGVLLLFVWESDWKQRKEAVLSAVKRLLKDPEDIDPILTKLDTIRYV